MEEAEDAPGGLIGPSVHLTSPSPGAADHLGALLPCQGGRPAGGRSRPWDSGLARIRHA